MTKRNYIRTVIIVKGEWLFEANPDYFNPDNIKHIETKNELTKIEREIVRKQKEAKLP